MVLFGLENIFILRGVVQFNSFALMCFQHIMANSAMITYCVNSTGGINVQ